MKFLVLLKSEKTKSFPQNTQKIHSEMQLQYLIIVGLENDPILLSWREYWTNIPRCITDGYPRQQRLY